MRHFLLVSMGVVSVLGLGASCGGPRRGGAGQSCTSADDCESGLGCFAQLCVAADGGNGKRRKEGESCNGRRDCTTGLNCIANTCELPSIGSDGVSARYSGKGESCSAKNDCEPELSCVMGICRALEVPLAAVGKSCFRVECATKADCCQMFVPNMNCPTYEANCAMDPIFCNTFRSLCECSQDCVDELCVMGAPGCKTNAECTSTQTPFCVQSECRQCDTDASCGTSGTKCTDGICMAACRQDENCPLLHSCQDGVCVESGCKTDRECAFISKNPSSICADAECQVPCNADSDCASSPQTRGFEICQMGRCEFVGCESNSECRALLGLENQKGSVQAVCR